MCSFISSSCQVSNGLQGTERSSDLLEVQLVQNSIWSWAMCPRAVPSTTWASVLGPVGLCECGIPSLLSSPGDVRGEEAVIGGVVDTSRGALFLEGRIPLTLLASPTPVESKNASGLSCVAYRSL